MKLTVLGNNGPYQAAGGACSGYLLTDETVNILIDCGNGVLGNLQKLLSFDKLDAIILTHLHSDHMSDMMVLRYAFQIKMSRGLIQKPVKVYAPAEPIDEFDRLKNPVFQLYPVNVDTILNLGKMTFNFKEMKHPVKCFAIGAYDGESRFVFSGDTAWTDNIIGFSRNADTIMLDAGLLTKDKTNNEVPHLTAAECGMVAKRAGVKKLLLTHFWPDYDKRELLTEAEEYFKNVECAELMKTYEV